MSARIPPSIGQPWLVLGVVAWLLLGCGGKLLVFGQGDSTRFRHRELGYEIAYPSVLDQPGWSMRNLDESDLLVVHRDGSSWAMASNCRETAASLELLAGELARAADGGEVQTRGTPIEHAGLQGWIQRIRRPEGDGWVEIKTVTLRGKRCTYDWIFVAPSAERLDALEGAFDQWWRSFQPGPGERSGGGRS
jgi:hypothetical protein